MEKGGAATSQLVPSDLAASTRASAPERQPGGFSPPARVAAALPPGLLRLPQPRRAAPAKRLPAGAGAAGEARRRSGGLCGPRSKLPGQVLHRVAGRGAPRRLSGGGGGVRPATGRGRPLRARRPSGLLCAKGSREPRCKGTGDAPPAASFATCARRGKRNRPAARPQRLPYLKGERRASSAFQSGSGRTAQSSAPFLTPPPPRAFCTEVQPPPRPGKGCASPHGRPRSPGSPRLACHVAGPRGVKAGVPLRPPPRRTLDSRRLECAAGGGPASPCAPLGPRLAAQDMSVAELYSQVSHGGRLYPPPRPGSRPGGFPLPLSSFPFPPGALELPPPRDWGPVPAVLSRSVPGWPCPAGCFGALGFPGLPGEPSRSRARGGDVRGSPKSRCRVSSDSGPSRPGLPRQLAGWTCGAASGINRVTVPCVGCPAPRLSPAGADLELGS